MSPVPMSPVPTSLQKYFLDAYLRVDRPVPPGPAHALAALLLEHADLRASRLAVDDRHDTRVGDERRTREDLAAVFLDNEHLIERQLVAPFTGRAGQSRHAARHHLHLMAASLNDCVHCRHLCKRDTVQPASRGVKITWDLAGTRLQKMSVGEDSAGRPATASRRPWCRWRLGWPTGAASPASSRRRTPGERAARGDELAWPTAALLQQDASAADLLAAERAEEVGDEPVHELEIRGQRRRILLRVIE